MSSGADLPAAKDCQAVGSADAQCGRPEQREQAAGAETDHRARHQVEQAPAAPVGIAGAAQRLRELPVEGPPRRQPAPDQAHGQYDEGRGEHDVGEIAQRIVRPNSSARRDAEDDEKERGEHPPVQGAAGEAARLPVAIAGELLGRQDEALAQEGVGVDDDVAVRQRRGGEPFKRRSGEIKTCSGRPCRVAWDGCLVLISSRRMLHETVRCCP